MLANRKRRFAAFVVAIAVVIVAPLAVVAANAFDDVPDSNVHHDDITWLRDVGVTAGCNPPANTEFCPGEPVLRQQMASFMRRLAENEIVNAATAVEAEHATEADHATTAVEADHAATAEEAETLGGLGASQFTPRAAFNATDDLPEENPTLETTITAPAPGVLVLAGTADGLALGDQDTFRCMLMINGDVVVGTVMFASVGVGNPEENCTTSGAANVPAGTHTVALHLLSVDADIGLFNASVTATWIPLDGTGQTPTDITPLADPAEDVASDRTR